MREYNNKNNTSPLNEQIDKSVIELKDVVGGHKTREHQENLGHPYKSAEHKKDDLIWEEKVQP